MKKNYFIISFCALIMACSSDDKNCLRQLEQAQLPPSTQVTFKQVYSDSNYEISISPFMTPNGDGLQDSYVIYIRDLNNNNYYITSDRDFASSIDPNTTENPSGFFTAIALSVSDDCETKNVSNDINNYRWNLDFDNQISEGNYNLDFTLDTVNGNPITVSTSFDLFYPNF
jgi:hypothetical protein